MLTDTYYTKDGHKLEIFTDEYAEDPREWDNLCEMICFHNNYALGDKHDLDPSDYNSWKEMRDAISLPSDIVVPLYLYDHGGITIATKPFGCRWDSGQVGYAIVPVNKIVLEYGSDSEENRATALRVLESEVKTYDNYIRGNCYSYTLTDDNDEILDSCSGFYGHDHEASGLLESAGITKDEVA